MTIFQVLREVTTAEDFIHAVADLGDPETGACDNWDETDMLATMEEIITCARRFQDPISHSRSILLDALAQAEEGLRRKDKRASALAAVRQALKWC